MSKASARGSQQQLPKQQSRILNVAIRENCLLLGSEELPLSAELQTARDLCDLISNKEGYAYSYVRSISTRLQ